MARSVKNYIGSCHCGAVRFSVQMPEPETSMLCDCSICRRKGIVMSDELVSGDDLKVQDDQKTLRIYQFGSQAACHHFCGTCGIHIFVETRLNPGYFRVNLGCIEGVDPFSLENKVYDGKSL